MKKLEKYTGGKTYMFPSGAIATPEVVKAQFPAIEIFAHIIETDQAGEVCFAVMNLAAMRSQYEIDPELTENQAIAALEEIINAPPPEPEPGDDPLAVALLALAETLETMNEQSDFVAGMMEGAGYYE